MVRTGYACALLIAAWLVASLPATSSSVARAQSPTTSSPTASPPTTYELIINGESFLVQTNRLTKLESSKRPGTSYNVALRIAPTQRITLDAVRFDYDRSARVEDNRKHGQRTVRLTHELGFTMLITELGVPLEGPDLDEALKMLGRIGHGKLREAPDQRHRTVGTPCPAICHDQGPRLGDPLPRCTRVEPQLSDLRAQRPRLQRLVHRAVSRRRFRRRQRAAEENARLVSASPVREYGPA